MADGRKVTVQEACLVTPEQQVQQGKRTLLSAFSHFAWFTNYRTRFLFFRRPSKRFEEIVKDLKRGLRRVLVDFHPVAGRIAVREDLRMELDDGGQGVYFAQAIANFSLQDLGGDDNFDGIAVHLLLGLAQTGKHLLQWPWKSDAPLFFIQVTGFCCGGICLSLRFSHQLMDGTSAWHFFQAWAETCSGRCISRQPQLIDMPMNSLPSSEQQQPSLLPPWMKLCSRSDILGADDASPASLAELRTRSFAFTPAFIAELKRRRPAYTTFELLTSHLWHKLTLASRRPDADGAAYATLIFAVNCRSRLPRLPDGYLGTAALLAAATGDVASIRADSSGAAATIRAAVGGAVEGMEASLAAVERHACDPHRVAFLALDAPVAVHVGSSFHFPVYEDLGFGKPDGMTILPIAKDGKLYYFPGAQPGSVVAYVPAPPEVMDELLRVMWVI